MSEKKKVVVGILNPGESPADNGRTIHALKLALGLHEGGAEVVLLFEGRGVTWLPRFLQRNDDSHPFVKNYGPVFDAVRPLARACNMCCKRFDVLEAAQAREVPVLGEGTDHADVAAYMLDGFEVVNH